MNENSVTLEMLREKYGVKAIICHHVRHGFKAPDNHITLECLATIATSGFPRLSSAINVLHRGSALIRTSETGGAAKKWIEENGGKIEKTLAGESELGSNEIFSMFNENVMKGIKDEGMKNYEAVKTYAWEPLIKWKIRLEKAVRGVFKQLEAGDNCLVPSHSPTVELIFNTFSYPEKADDKIFLKELEGIFLVLTEDGDIMVHR